MEPSATRPARTRRPRWVVAADSAIHGRGVYAVCDIPAETRVLEYRGERITLKEADRREHLRRQREARGLDGAVYIFILNSRYALDGRARSNVARLINHSCAPNCRSEIIRGRIWIVADRDIPAGAELTFDYGYSYRESWLHPCRCGAQTCPGYIVNAQQRWMVRRRLARLGGPPPTPPGVLAAPSRPRRRRT